MQGEKVIIVAAHKRYTMPADSLYLPLQVGAEGKSDIGYRKDNEGENISEKNPYYCELTGLYWAWKNLECEYLGLAHYRRHFKGKACLFLPKFKKILTAAQLEKKLKKYDVLLPKKRHYYIETNRSQYLHAHHAIGLQETENVIKEFYSEYLPSWDAVMKKRSGHRFNMFIMKKSLADKYCEWLFDILGKVEERIDISDWNQSEQRVFGYLSERLLDVWILKNKINYKDIPYMYMEKQSWLKKSFNFVKRKFKVKI
mgnify:CR=1 FL=1